MLTCWYTQSPVHLTDPQLELCIVYCTVYDLVKARQCWQELLGIWLCVKGYLLSEHYRFRVLLIIIKIKPDILSCAWWALLPARKPQNQVFKPIFSVWNIQMSDYEIQAVITTFIAVQMYVGQWHFKRILFV